MPFELRAQRTVLCMRLDELIYEHDKDNIKKEVERVQTWAKITDVYKFPRSNTIKITFQSSAMATKARENGLLMFSSLSVTPEQIREEIYIPIVSCDRCYAIESHTTNMCPNKPREYKVCSECGANGHTFRECRATTKGCLN